MTEDTPLPFDLPAVHRKKITVDFNGGNQSSNAGLLLLREAERERNPADPPDGHDVGLPTPPLTAANLARAIMSSTQVGSGVDRKGSP
jgi:hypothetical protein